ncbi:vegetative cell wall protein gp1-like [Helicoverpa zea]|uniref:vegetative cell wall protein gp1-like n=1 Tax=Helicoverpa zea TaxID=7113 RepID=UPI001F597923|nr:vegetative cell wall protein gp1-like [Helicoverpa zea]
MGAPAGVPKGARRPSHVAYYVALVGILSLLVMLCLYFCYYFVKKVRELSSAETLSLPGASCRPPPAPAYPVQPVVRDSASAMAKLCKQVPGGGYTVFPAATSPAALRASTGEPDPRGPAPGPDVPPAPGPEPEPRPRAPDAGAAEPRPDKPPPALSVTAASDALAR